MIFVTVGTQLAFPRLIRHMDSWAGASGKEVVAQVGPDRSIYRNLTPVSFLQKDVLEGYFRRAELVVGHVGMGTVLSARALGVPLVLFARSAALGEHRNDHQAASARALRGFPGVWIADDLLMLSNYLDSSATLPRPEPRARSFSGVLEARVSIELSRIG